jgi:hypothetical protein
VIEPGRDWAEPGSLSPDEVTVASNAELSAWLATRRDKAEGIGRVGVVGGDLARTVGIGPANDPRRPWSDDARTYSADLCEALVDGRRCAFACHLVASAPRSWRRGRRFTVIANTPWWGAYNVAPKAHPNDGLLDVVEFDLGAREWRPVRARLASGSFLPHPRIRMRRDSAYSVEWSEPRSIVIDDVAIGRARRIAVRVQPDAWTFVA